jgi:nitrous oxidase accessory protein NosD
MSPHPPGADGKPARCNNSILFTDRIDDSVITANIIERGSIYTSCLDAAKNFNHRVAVTSNSIRDGGIILQNTSDSACRGNQISGGGLAIKTCEDVTVSENRVSGASAAGIHLLPTQGGAFANRRIRVVGNVSFNNGVARTPGTRCGIIVDQGESIDLIANRCYDTGGGDQLFGLYVNAAKELRFLDNDFDGNAKAARDVFTGTVTFRTAATRASSE